MVSLMKTKLIALIMVSGFGVHAQEFRANVYNLNKDDFYVISGQFVAPKPDIRKESIKRLRQMNAELEVSIANMRSEYYARQQTYELRRQTELLEKISKK